MLFHIFHLSALAHMECVNPAVFAHRLPAVVDPAARNDEDVRPLFHIEVIVDRLSIVRLRDDDGDMNTLPLCLLGNKDIDPRLPVLTGFNADVRRAPPPVAFPVLADIVCPVGNLVQIGDLLKQHSF